MWLCIRDKKGNEGAKLVSQLGTLVVVMSTTNIDKELAVGVHIYEWKGAGSASLVRG